MRAKISERNIFPSFNLYEEYTKIEYLLSEYSVVGSINRFGKHLNPELSIERYVNDFAFLNWNLRGTFLSTEEMRKGLGIDRERLTEDNMTEEIILDFVQYAANCNLQLLKTLRSYSNVYLADTELPNALIKNMGELIHRLGAHFSVDEEESEVSIVFDDDISVVVAEDFPEIQRSLLEYRKIDNRGDIQRKGEVLCSLFKRLEAEESKFKGTTYQNLCSDTSFLFNKTGARHWVEKDKIASRTFLKMPQEELDSGMTGHSIYSYRVW